MFLCSLQIVMPVFEASHYREHLAIIDLIISFNFIEGFGNEGAGISLLVILQNTEDASCGKARRVSFNSERFGGIEIMKDWFGGETLLEVIECKFFVFTPLPFLILTCQVIKRGGDFGKVLDKATIKVGET